MITLRSYRNDDAVALQLLANDPINNKNVGDTFPYPYTLEAAQWRITEGSAAKPGERKENFAVCLGDTLIGGGSYEQRKKGRHAHHVMIGYRLGEAYRGKGYGTELCRQLVDLVFTMYADVNKIGGAVFGWNSASARVLEKNGFVREGILREEVVREGEFYDEWLYGLLRSEREEKTTK